MEDIVRKCGQIAVGSAAKGAEALQIVDGFEKARLSLCILADHGHTLRRKTQPLKPEIPEVPGLEGVQDHEQRRKRGIPYILIM